MPDKVQKEQGKHDLVLCDVLQPFREEGMCFYTRKVIIWRYCLNPATQRLNNLPLQSENALPEKKTEFPFGYVLKRTGHQRFQENSTGKCLLFIFFPAKQDNNYACQ